MEGTLHEDPEEVAGKGSNSLKLHHNLVRHASSDENTRSKRQQWRKNGKYSPKCQLSHLKSAELEPTHPRMGPQSDIVKDDPGPCAVFTEQRSKASHEECTSFSMSFQDYQDAQDNKRMQYQLAPKSMLKTTNSECPDTCKGRHKWPKSSDRLTNRFRPSWQNKSSSLSSSSSAGPPKIRSTATIFLPSLSWGSSRGIVGAVQGSGPPEVRVWASLGSRVPPFGAPPFKAPPFALFCFFF